MPLVVRANLSWEEMARIEVAVPELAGVAIDQGLIRHYPYGPTAAHVLGYVAAVSEKELTGDPLLELPDFRIGKSGIEKVAGLALRGVAGTSEVEVNAYGRVVREIAHRPGPARRGRGPRARHQRCRISCTRAAPASPASPACVLDAATGDVLALVSSPSYDPMLFSTGLTQAVWQELSTDPAQPADRQGDRPASIRPARHSSRWSRWPRSTPESSPRRPPVSCPGYLELGNATFHCWKQGGHGTLRLRDAIKQSCDVFFYETARRIGIDRLAAMARRFGFGGRSASTSPASAAGLIPTPRLEAGDHRQRLARWARR